jgi:hypothetical protein
MSELEDVALRGEILSRFDPAVVRAHHDKLLALGRAMQRRPQFTLVGPIAPLGSVPPAYLDNHFTILQQIVDTQSHAAGSFLDMLNLYCPNPDEHPAVIEALPAILQKYGPGVSRLFYEMVEDLVPFEERHGELTERNRQELGVSYVARYLSGRSVDDVDVSLLEENLENLDPGVRDDRPLALAIYTKSDPKERAFARLYGHLRPIGNKYKLIVAEASTKQEVFSIIEKVVGIHGWNKDGTPKKPLDLFVLGAHGTSLGMILGEYDFGLTYRQGLEQHPNRFLTSADIPWFADRKAYFARDANNLLHSCSTGKNILCVPSFAYRLRDALEHTSVSAPTDDVSSVIYVSRLGRVIGLSDRSETGRYVTLKPTVPLN